ncbi:MAG: hypothetical protein IPJ01_11385 [Micavibrio sp.]|nr:hypothetical protein [Micavibrio sp.]
MKSMTLEDLKKSGYQDLFQFGSRVETPCGKRGIVLFNSGNIDLCRVYYDEGEETKDIMVKISECRLLSCEEAVGI